MTTYDLNKMAYAQLPTLSTKEVMDYTEKVSEFLSKNPSKYYLMLNNDVHYYTVYVFKGMLFWGKMAKEILDVSLTLGEIKGIEFYDDKIEIWIMYNGECHAFYLFNYAQGVIEV